MQILPQSQIKNLPILEDVLEELRLNIVDHIFNIGDALNLYSLNSEDLKRKLNLLGLTNITIGKYLSLDLSSDIYEFISPEFYKMYRKLNQHRGNNMAMDYIFHSAGMLNTLVRSNEMFNKETSVFNDSVSFFDFSAYRDNQLPELGIGDGYIIVPYDEFTEEKLKLFLAKNPIIFSFIPAGYTFIFLSSYRNLFNNPVLQYDNCLNYEDISNREYMSLYWESYRTSEDYRENDVYTVDENIEDKEGNVITLRHVLKYYNPFSWRDHGKAFLIKDDPRFTNDDVYRVPLIVDGVLYPTLEEYLCYYNDTLINDVMNEVKQGYYTDLNNQLYTKDIWLGDKLLPGKDGDAIDSLLMDHVYGLKSIHAPTYSYASLYKRGESLASQYLQREEKIISKSDELIQEKKKDIISDRRETDLVKITFTDEYSVWIKWTNNINASANMINEYLGYTYDDIFFMLEDIPVCVKDCMSLEEAYDLYNTLVNDLPYEDSLMIYCIKDYEGNEIISNDPEYTESCDFSQSMVVNHAHTVSLSTTLPDLSLEDD